jgi:hypothetical protein
MGTQYHLFSIAITTSPQFTAVIAMTRRTNAIEAWPNHWRRHGTQMKTFIKLNVAKFANPDDQA